MDELLMYVVREATNATAGHNATAAHNVTAVNPAAAALRPDGSKLTFRDGTAILQVIVFVFYLASAIFAVIKHRRLSDGEWYIFITFSLLRIIGACFQLSTIHDPSKTNFQGALTCAAVGIGPLTMVNTGMLSRLNKFIPKKIPNFLFGAFTIASIVGIIIASYGGSLSRGSDKPFSGNAYVQAAVCMFATSYGVVTSFFFIVLAQGKHIPKPEQRLLVCTALCRPFIMARLIYAMIGDFSDLTQFNLMIGSTTLYFCMSVLPEILACGICLITGIMTRPIPSPEEWADDPGAYYELK